MKKFIYCVKHQSMLESVAEPERSFRFASESFLNPLLIAIRARYGNMFSNGTITRFESSEISHFISGGAHTKVSRSRPD